MTRVLTTPSLPDRPSFPIGAVLATLIAAAFAMLVWTLGSTNPFTPAGYVGYLTKGAVFGKSRFYGVQRGPTSAGRSWPGAFPCRDRR